MADRSIIEFLLKGIDQTAQATQSSAANLNKIAKAANTLQSIALVQLAKRSIKATAEVVKLGADSLKTRDRLVAFAGGARQADEMLEALNRSSDGTIDRLSGMAMATSLIEQRLVSTTREMELAAAMVSKLGRSSLSTEGRMNSLTMMLSNESRRRLDDFGLSVADVTERQAELVAQGMASQEAFKTAVFEQAAAKLGILGDQSKKAYTEVATLEANWKSMTQVIGESMAVTAAAGGVMGTVSKMIADMTQQTQDWSAAQARAKELGFGTRWAEAYAIASRASRTFQGDEENLRAAIEEKNAAMVAAAATTENTTAADWEAVQRSRGIYDLYAGFAAQHQQGKMDEATAVEQANARMAASTVNYAAQAASVYASLAALEVSHTKRMEAIATQGVGGGRKSLMGEISKAQSRELAALQAQFDERDWNRSLEEMAEDHQDRLSKIKKEGWGDDYDEQIRAEHERFTDARESAIARREQRKADEAARAAIVKKYDARRRDEQAAMEAASAGQAAAAQQAALEAEVESYEQRKAALEAQLANQYEQQALVIEAHKELLDTIRKYAEKTKERIDAIVRRNAQVSGTPPGERPRRYAAGTTYHPGGGAWVGEREPEFLQLPVGSRVTPGSKMGGGVTIVNHFGRDSIRSDRDITRLEQRQKQSLRLHGRAN